MSAPMNTPAYHEGWGDVPPPNATYAETGVYVDPTYIDLSPRPAAPGTALPPLAPELSEQDYAPGRFASGGDVDRHINTDEHHGPSYGKPGPRPFDA